MSSSPHRCTYYVKCNSKSFIGIISFNYELALLTLLLQKRNEGYVSVYSGTHMPIQSLWLWNCPSKLPHVLLIKYLVDSY